MRFHRVFAVSFSFLLRAILCICHQFTKKRAAHIYFRPCVDPFCSLRVYVCECGYIDWTISVAANCFFFLYNRYGFTILSAFTCVCCPLYVYKWVWMSRKTTTSKTLFVYIQNRVWIREKSSRSNSETPTKTNDDVLKIAAKIKQQQNANKSAVTVIKSEQIGFSHDSELANDRNIFKMHLDSRSYLNI